MKSDYLEHKVRFLDSVNSLITTQRQVPKYRTRLSFMHLFTWKHSSHVVLISSRLSPCGWILRILTCQSCNININIFWWLPKVSCGYDAWVHVYTNLPAATNPYDLFLSFKEPPTHHPPPPLFNVGYIMSYIMSSRPSFPCDLFHCAEWI